MRNLPRILFFATAFCILGLGPLFAQTALQIPPALTGSTFQLNVQAGTQSFYPPTATPTFGVNGPFLAPTLIVNKGDQVTMHVTNNLNTSTTMHWHGLHVPPQDDGGPHQVIFAGTTWSPDFEIKNNAGTFWYHPHGDRKTDLQVSKGIAGMIIVHDSEEMQLDLPRTYGVDDFPVIVQTKAFDGLKQIAIATEDDTAMFVNGTLHPYLDAPAQVIRLRMLNGSSMRTYNFGFTGDLPFEMIATDAGLLDSAVTLSRIRLSPGERAEILLDLVSMQGQTISLRNFGSELPLGIYGALQVGGGTAVIPGYGANFLNGADYDIMPILVGPQTSNPVTTLPSLLVPNVRWDTLQIVRNRIIRLEPLDGMDSSTFAEGPFAMNGVQFDMDSINEIAYLGDVEKWRLENHTEVAHPFHIHDMHFYVANVNGNPTPVYEAGKKDVVLVMPHEYVEFITRFEDFANDEVPYMYHCHLLHHEDDGMMGALLVIDTTATGIETIALPLPGVLFPNPVMGEAVWIRMQAWGNGPVTFEVADLVGALVQSGSARLEGDLWKLNIQDLPCGTYILRLQSGRRSTAYKLVKQ